jgi:predicted deacetylase
MSARYIVRLDDACPTMRAETWGPLESLLDELGIKPLVGVVPDNRDPKLMCSPADTDFWGRVRRWQTNGWDLALHGLHHVYYPIAPAARPILRLQDESEFVGLPLEEQKRKISAGYATMAAAGVHPRIFMAPSHTFDRLTLQALREVTDIRVIADGHALRAYDAAGFTWIPQQLWRYREMPLGVWCICLHPNTMSQTDLRKVSTDLRRHAARFISTAAALKEARRRTALDHAFAAAFRVARTIKKRRRDD